MHNFKFLIILSQTFKLCSDSLKVSTESAFDSYCFSFFIAVDVLFVSLVAGFQLMSYSEFAETNTAAFLEVFYSMK